MRQPMAGVGLAVVLGAVVWPWWRPSLVGCGLALGALVLVAGVGRRHAVAWAALFAAALLLGSAAAADQAARRPTVARSWVHGRVTRTSGHNAWVDTPDGPLRLRVTDPVGVGQVVVARTTALTRLVRLPGEPGGALDDLRAGVLPRRATGLLAAGRPPRPPHGDQLDLAVHAGLLRALAFGDRSGVDDDLRALLRRTGTAHLLAISGLHVGLLAGAVGALVWLVSRPLTFTSWWRLARYLPPLAAACAAVGYAGAVGAPASARRAAIMVVAAAGTALLGRRPRAWTLLGSAATVVVLGQPGLVGDLGFQLSFSAVVGMLLVGPRVTRLLPPDSPRWLVWLVGSLSATLGATAGTLPLSALYFQQLAPVSPLANLFAGPLVGAVGVPAALLGATVPGPVGIFSVALADGAVGLCLDLLRMLDGTSWTPAVGPLGALLLAVAVLLCRRPGAAAGLTLLALGLHSLPRDRLIVTFLGVGQGDSALIEWPDGRRWLVDGGPSAQPVLRYLRRRGIRHLDAVVLSHAHPDHIGGLLPVLDQLPVDALWLPRRPTHDLPQLLALWQSAFAQGSAIVLPDDVPPQGIDGVHIDHPRSGWIATGRDKLNEESLVFHIHYGAHSVLFAGDIEEDAEQLLSVVLPPVTVVKVPHHGSASSSSLDFVARTRPALAVISCGKDNRYRHPRPRTVAAWTLSSKTLSSKTLSSKTLSSQTQPADAPLCVGTDPDGRGAGEGACRTRLLRTDTDGTVEWSSDGQRWSLRTWRVTHGWRGRALTTR